MLITTIKLHGRPEKRKEIMQTLKGLTRQLAKDRGCLRADLYQDIDDKDTLYVIEEWRSQEDLDRYKSSRSLAVLLGLESLLVKPAEIQHAVKLAGKTQL